MDNNAQALNANKVHRANDETQILKKVGSVIKQLREANGFSCREFATRVGRTQEFIEQLEDGRVDVDLLTLKRCADALQTEVHDLALAVMSHAKILVLVEDEADENTG